MPRHIRLSELTSDRFLREIHHFLWTDSSLSGNVVDAGWNCRDHAWVVALLIQSLGYKPAFFHGEAFFVNAETKKSGNVSFYQRPHSWVAVENVGAIDLSIKPNFSSADDHLRIPIKCIFANQCLPRGRKQVIFYNQGNTHLFTRAIEYPEQLSSKVAATYLIKEAEHIHPGHLQQAAGWIGSPLTARLHATYGNPSDLYAALLVHMRSFLDHRAPSLTGLSWAEAWRRLADDREDATGQTSQFVSVTKTLAA